MRRGAGRGLLDNYQRFHLPEFSTPFITERIDLRIDDSVAFKGEETESKLKGK
jgi:hypothetical protein